MVEQYQSVIWFGKKRFKKKVTKWLAKFLSFYKTLVQVKNLCFLCKVLCLQNDAPYIPFLKMSEILLLIMSCQLSIVLGKLFRHYLSHWLTSWAVKPISHGGRFLRHWGKNFLGLTLPKGLWIRWPMTLFGYF